MRRWTCLFLPFLVCCTTTSPPPRLDPCSVVQCVPHDAAGVQVVNNRLYVREKALTPQFVALQSFDVSLERREIAFSAKRKDNFDIGIVSLDGSDIHWVPEDPRDETDVQWAPRGNKISFIVHGTVGDIVRTVHVPTATQLSVEFKYATVEALAWDKAAERYAVVLTSPDASQRIESVKYDGTGRRTDVAPKVKLDVTEEPIGGALVMRPPVLHYGEKIPLVVQVADPPFVWNGELGALMQKKRTACAIMRSAPDGTFWAAIRATPWIDSSQIAVRGSR